MHIPANSCLSIIVIVIVVIMSRVCEEFYANALQLILLLYPSLAVCVRLFMYVWNNMPSV